MKRTKIWFVLIVSLVLSISSIYSSASKQYTNEDNYFFDLIFEKIIYFDENAASFIIEDLKQIGINASLGDFIYWDWPPTIPIFSDCLIESDLYSEPYRTPVVYFTDEVAWGYGTDFPYSYPYFNQSMEMIKEFELQTNISLLLNQYKEWQQFAFDKILLIIPLFNDISIAASWSNLKGYNHFWGLIDSLPYMSFNSLHVNQNSTNRLVIPWEYSWSPFGLRYSSNYGFDLSNFFMEPIIKLTPEDLPTNRSIIENWEFVNSTHMSLSVRNNLFWSPSYNITEYSSDSEPPPLMYSLKDNSYSNGSNMQVTAYDVVFSLLMRVNEIVGSSYNNKWIKNLYVDPFNNLTLHLEINSNPETIYEKPFHIFKNLEQFCLPEFFLNSSSTEISSSGGIPTLGFFEGIQLTPQWESYFGTSPFGCGKYNMKIYEPDHFIYFTTNPNWHGIGAIDGSSLVVNLTDVQIFFSGNSNTNVNKLVSGIYDWIPEIKYASNTDLLDSDNFLIYKKPSVYQSGLIFNIYNEPFGGENNFHNLTSEGKEEYNKALAIRKAIAFATNRERINQELFNNKYYLSKSLVSLNYPSWIQDDYEYSYDLSKAWEWMEAAGYREEDLKGSTITVNTGFSTSLFIVSIVTLIYLKKKRKV